MQIVFQDPFASLYPAHDVAHHLRRPLLATRRATRGRDAEEEVAALLRAVNLTPEADLARKRPHELSGGQRLGAPPSLPQTPSGGTPMAGGGWRSPARWRPSHGCCSPTSRCSCWTSPSAWRLGLLDRLRAQRNLAVLYVTHDLATARHFADEVMVMYRGRIVERGPSDEVILRPCHPYTRRLAAAAPRGPAAPAA
nr:hypothetical protein [Streptomyces sp. 8K308]